MNYCKLNFQSSKHSLGFSGHFDERAFYPTYRLKCSLLTFFQCSKHKLMFYRKSVNFLEYSEDLLVSAVCSVSLICPGRALSAYQGRGGVAEWRSTRQSQLRTQDTSGSRSGDTRAEDSTWRQGRQGCSNVSSSQNKEAKQQIISIHDS